MNIKLYRSIDKTEYNYTLKCNEKIIWYGNSYIRALFEIAKLKRLRKYPTGRKDHVFLVYSFSDEEDDAE